MASYKQPNPAGNFLMALLTGLVAWGLSHLLGLGDPVSLFAVGLMALFGVFFIVRGLLDIERILRARAAKRRMGRRLSIPGRVLAFLQGRIITMAVIAAVAAPILYFFEDELIETGQTLRDASRTQREIELAMADDPLLKEKTFPFRRSVLTNPGRDIGLPEDVQQALDAQIGEIARSGQEVLCCDYDSAELPRVCTGVIMWKDRMPIPLEEIVDVHRNSALAYLGARAVSKCPKTRIAAWNIVGRIPGHGWSPMTSDRARFAARLRADMVGGN